MRIESVPEVSYLRLGPWDITVTIVADLKKDHGLYGDWDLDQHCIRLAADQPAASLAQTLLHELLHAVSDLYHLRLTEQSVRCLENAAAQVIRDYPVAAAAWLKALHT